VAVVGVTVGLAVAPMVRVDVAEWLGVWVGVPDAVGVDDGVAEAVSAEDTVVVLEGVEVAMGDAVAVAAPLVCVGLPVGSGGHPFSAAPTALSRQSTVT
jgi:hypothetical protein